MIEKVWQMADITIIGNAIVDVTVRPVTDDILKNSSTPVETIRIAYGGDALNEAVSLAHFGKAVELITNLGDDDAGRRVISHLKQNHVDTEKIIVRKDVETSVNIVLVEGSGERHFLTVPTGSQRKLCEEDIMGSLDAIGGIVSFASIFVSHALDIGALTRIFAKIKERGSVLCVDMTTPKHGERLEDMRELLQYVDYIFPNEKEISMLTGCQDPVQNARLLTEAGVGHGVIKCGAKGCVIADGECVRTIPAYPVERCVDTTGAGDSFVSAYLWALSEEWSDFDAACFAVAASSLTVEQIGGAAGTHSVEAAMERYETVKKRAASIGGAAGTHSAEAAMERYEIVKKGAVAMGAVTMTETAEIKNKERMEEVSERQAAFLQHGDDVLTDRHNPPIVLPDYDHCVLSTVSSILKYYQVQTPYTSLPALDQKLAETSYKNVVLLVLDGLGEYNLHTISPDGFLAAHEADCVTSVYPSTTTAALTTYYSGLPPYETGWIGWSQYFKEYGRALDMFSQRESYEHKPLADTKRDVIKECMNYDLICTRIEAASPHVEAYDLAPEYTRVRGGKQRYANDIDALMQEIRTLCSRQQDTFIIAYCDNPDGLFHANGTDAPVSQDFVLDAQRKIQALASELSEDTLLIVTADHGHKNTSITYEIMDYPEIWECLVMPPSLEARAVVFQVKEQMRGEFEARFQNAFGDDFMLMRTEEFLERHFLGYGKKHPKIDDFLGNYMALSVKSAAFRLGTWLGEPKKKRLSTHGGLTKEEMEVPVILIPGEGRKNDVADQA